MFSNAVTRSILASLALAATTAAAFLPALHLVPGLEHAGCGVRACGCDDSSRDVVRRGDPVCTIACDAKGLHEHGSPCAGADCDASPTLALNSTSSPKGCMLCKLFEGVRWSTSDAAFSPEIARVSTPVERANVAFTAAVTLTAHCRGPPAVA